MTINLNRINYGIVLDGSGSMDDPEKRGARRTRWQAARESTAGAALKVVKKDPDGIDIALINRSSLKVAENVTNGDMVDQIFVNNSPDGGTPIHLALQWFSDRFKAMGNDVTRTFVFVVTDGVPDDEGKVERVIVDLATYMANNDIPDDYFTFLFIQVGDNSRASAYLDRLDNGIKAKCHGLDIVDARSIEKLGTLSLNDVIQQAIAD